MTDYLMLKTKEFEDRFGVILFWGFTCDSDGEITLEFYCLYGCENIYELKLKHFNACSYTTNCEGVRECITEAEKYCERMRYGKDGS